MYHGSDTDRKKLQLKFKLTYKINDLYYYPIIITTYEIVQKDIKFLKTFMWTYITMDEGHKLKNTNTMISQYVNYINVVF